MSLTLLRDLDRRNVAFDHDFIFKSRSLDFKALITRYRGTNCTRAQHGVIVTAWQRSFYRFGSFPLAETIVATILVRWDGTVHGLSLDGRSHGGLGPLCDFKTLQRCMSSALRGRKFAEFSRVVPSPGCAQCLHLFEVLSGASDFYAHLRANAQYEGSEEELLRILPRDGEIVAENRHWVLGQEQETTITLRHEKKPETTPQRLPVRLCSRMTIRCDGSEILAEPILADDTRDIYGQMNRALAKYSRMEKKTFHVKGRMRFSNMPAFVGLMLLTLSHESMHVFRAVRIAWMLRHLQQRGERDTCIAFQALLDTYQ